MMFPWKKSARLLAIWGGALSLMAGASAAKAQTATATQKFSAAAQANFQKQLHSFQTEKRLLTPAQRKLSSVLAVSLPANRARISADLKAFRGYAPTDSSGRSDVVITGTVTPSLLSAITSAGGKIISVTARTGAVRAKLSPSGAESVAALGEVKRVRLFLPPILRAGPKTTQGDVAHAAAPTRSIFGVTGKGIKIGVLSDGVDSLLTSQNSGELGPVTVVNDFGVPQSGLGDEGTAMLEIVHDIAPEADLYFATGSNGMESFANNIRLLRAAGCNIIVDDIGYFEEGVYQDDVVSQAVNDVTADGALFFSAAGNDGSADASTSSTWDGQFRDGGTIDTLYKGTAKYHLWGTSQFDTVVSAGFGYAVLNWADPLQGAVNDYDLYLTDNFGNIVGASFDFQDGTGFGVKPQEVLFCYRGAHIVAALASGEPRPLRLQIPGGQLSIGTSGAIYGHSAASSTVGVAAVRAQAAGVTFNPFSKNNRVEYFSSDGYRTYYFDVNGNRKTFTVQTPQIAAADGVTTSVPGFTAFYGTSAAAPHAAAIAALVWSYDLTQSAADVKKVLFTSALDVMGSGFDRNSGYGIVMADRALAQIGPPTLSIVSAVSTTEGNNNTKTLDFTVTLSKKSSNDVTVNYATVDKSAKAGSDYNAASGTLTIPAGQTTGTISVTVRGDTTYEPDETFQVVLSNSSIPVTGSLTSTGTIKNDDHISTSVKKNSNAGS